MNVEKLVNRVTKFLEIHKKIPSVFDLMKVYVALSNKQHNLTFYTLLEYCVESLENNKLSKKLGFNWKNENIVTKN